MVVTIEQLMEQSRVGFGTSGARGLVSDMTGRICFAYTVGFLDYLKSIGEFRSGSQVALAGDLRPSSPTILEACAAGIRACDGVPTFLGFVPTPTLAYYAFQRSIPSLMVTGSHIPQDRNGIKFYRPKGEILKEDEEAIRRQLVDLDDALFDDDGGLLTPPSLGDPLDVSASFVDRYRHFFGTDALAGMRLGIYQHSAVGRDLIARIVESLGATAVPFGRSDSFIPVDTEAVRDEDIELAREWAAKNRCDAILSTDGDSDRPLLANERGEWIRGDRLGVLASLELQADSIVTPVSSSTVAERCGGFASVVRTRIGSPFVIEAMNVVRVGGSEIVIGYEANGGLLLGSDLRAGPTVLAALPTRDAVLPMIAALVAARRVGGLGMLEDALPKRATVSDRIKDVPIEATRKLFRRWLDSANRDERLATEFSGPFGGLEDVDLTDGIRMTMADSTIVHLRPSGNAPELRCYAEADDHVAASVANMETLKRVRELIEEVGTI